MPVRRVFNWIDTDDPNGPVFDPLDNVVEIFVGP